MLELLLGKYRKISRAEYTEILLFTISDQLQQKISNRIREITKIENNNNTRFLRGKLLNTEEKITGRQKQIHYVKYCYNHTEFNHSPKLSKLQRNTNSKYQVSLTTLKSQTRPSEYKIKIKPCIFFLSPTLSFFLSPVHSLPLLLGLSYCLCTLPLQAAKPHDALKPKSFFSLQEILVQTFSSPFSFFFVGYY